MRGRWNCPDARRPLQRAGWNASTPNRRALGVIVGTPTLAPVADPSLSSVPLWFKTAGGMAIQASISGPGVCPSGRRASAARSAMRRPHHAGQNPRPLRSYRSAVRSTSTPRNRAGAQPWLTAFDCPGSPLPSWKLPLIA